MRLPRTDASPTSDDDVESRPLKSQPIVNQQINSDSSDVTKAFDEVTSAAETADEAAEAEIAAFLRVFTDEQFSREVERVGTYGQDPSRPELELEVRAAIERIRQHLRKAAEDPAYGQIITRKLRRRLRAIRRQEKK
jgi:hypothetical protein